MTQTSQESKVLKPHRKMNAFMQNIQGVCLQIKMQLFMLIQNVFFFLPKEGGCVFL